MTAEKIAHLLATTLICLVWFINGLYCKILNLVPRHQQIVARILGDEYSWILTQAIGIAELLMVVWILSGIKSRICAKIQMTIIAAMNVIEFIMVPDLLLFGRMNIIFALIFIRVIYINEFLLPEHKPNPVIK